jgi:hypothetical protein
MLGGVPRVHEQRRSLGPSALHNEKSNQLCLCVEAVLLILDNLRDYPSLMNRGTEC